MLYKQCYVISEDHIELKTEQTKNKHTHTTQEDEKLDFLKQQVHNADIYKSVLIKIMSTQE